MLLSSLGPSGLRDRARSHSGRQGIKRRAICYLMKTLSFRRWRGSSSQCASLRKNHRRGAGGKATSAAFDQVRWGTSGQRRGTRTSAPWKGLALCWRAHTLMSNRAPGWKCTIQDESKVASEALSQSRV